MYVRLSDGGDATDQQEDLFPFVYIPNLKMYVREDYLDDLTDNEWRVMMAQIALVQPEVTSGQKTRAQFMADRATRKATRGQKKSDKHDKSQAKTEIKKAKAENKKSGKAGDVLGSVVKGLGGLLGKGNTDTTTVPDDTKPDDSKKPTPPDASAPWYTSTGAQVGIAVGAVALIGGIALAVRSRSN